MFESYSLLSCRKFCENEYQEPNLVFFLLAVVQCGYCTASATKIISNDSIFSSSQGIYEG